MSLGLTLVVPSIRANGLVRLYKSVDTYFPWEMIAVGPKKEPPKRLMKKDNFKWIQDKGSPIRCSQMAAIQASMSHVMVVGDDCWFKPKRLDKMLECFDDKKCFGNTTDVKNVVSACYVEGKNDDYDRDTYFFINTHEVLKCSHVSPSTPIWNVATISKAFYKQLGGFDCRYQGLALGLADLAVRGSLLGANTYLLADDTTLYADQFPGCTGDHAPVHKTQIHDDEPLYAKKWREPKRMLKKNLRVPLNNWKKAPSWWSPRFGETKAQRADRLRREKVFAKEKVANEKKLLERMRQEEKKEFERRSKKAQRLGVSVYELFALEEQKRLLKIHEKQTIEEKEYRLNERKLCAQSLREDKGRCLIDPVEDY